MIVHSGGMREWLKRAVLKTAVPETVPGVRIPLPPPASLNRRETAPPFAAKYAKMPVFRNISSAKRTGENGLPGIEWRQSTGLSLEGTLAVRFQ